MRKLSTLFATIFCLLFCSCGGGGKSSSQDAGSNNPDGTIVSYEDGGVSDSSMFDDTDDNDIDYITYKTM